MENRNLKEKVHQLVEESDDDLLEILFQIAQNHKNAGLVTMDDETEMQELDQRRQKRMAGKSEVYSWDDARKMIVQRIGR